MKVKLFLLLFCVLRASGQGWSTNYQSYTSPKDVNSGKQGDSVNVFVDPAKNSVDGGGGIGSGGQVSDISLQSDSPIKKNGVGGGVDGGNGRQSMFYYEMFPEGGGSGGTASIQNHPKPVIQHASQGRQLCSYTESGAMRCQPKTASFYPTYDVASSNSIPHYYYRRGGDSGGGGGGGGGYGESMGWGMEETSGGWGMEEEEKGGGGGGGSGLAGLLGLLGLLGAKGAKGLISIAPLLIALPFLPILLPIILLPLLLPLLLLLLFIPIPVVVTPGARSISGGITEFSARAVRLGALLPEMTADILQSEECVERISCEVARISRNFHVSDGWIDGLTSSLPKENKYTKKVLQGVYPEKKSEKAVAATSRKTSPDGGGGGGGDCSLFTCNAKSILAKHLTKV